MEKLVRVISQGAPQSRQWTNPNTGEMKTITSVEVEMTDGLDRFIAEASDDLANQLATGSTSRFARETTADTSASYKSADWPPLPSLPLDSLLALATNGTQEGEGPGVGSVLSCLSCL